MESLQKLMIEYVSWINDNKLPFKAADLILLDHYEELTFYQKMFLAEFLKEWIRVYKQEFGKGI